MTVHMISHSWLSTQLRCLGTWAICMIALQVSGAWVSASPHDLILESEIPTQMLLATWACSQRTGIQMGAGHNHDVLQSAALSRLAPGLNTAAAGQLASNVLQLNLHMHRAAPAGSERSLEAMLVVVHHPVNSNSLMHVRACLQSDLLRRAHCLLDRRCQHSEPRRFSRCQPLVEGCDGHFVIGAAQ